MEIPPGMNSGASPSKGAKVVVKGSATPAAVKKPRAARKTLTMTPVTEPAVVADKPASEDVGSMIATAAYYLAAARNFSPGHELDDWLEAERSVRAQLYG